MKKEITSSNPFTHCINLTEKQYNQLYLAGIIDRRTSYMTEYGNHAIQRLAVENLKGLEKMAGLGSKTAKSIIKQKRKYTRRMKKKA